MLNIFFSQFHIKHISTTFPGHNLQLIKTPFVEFSIMLIEGEIKLTVIR